MKDRRQPSMQVLLEVPAKLFAFSMRTTCSCPIRWKRLLTHTQTERRGGAFIPCSTLMPHFGPFLVRPTFDTRLGLAICEGNTWVVNLFFGLRQLPDSRSAGRSLKSCFQCRTTFELPPTIILRFVLPLSRLASTFRTPLLFSAYTGRMHI